MIGNGITDSITSGRSNITTRNNGASSAGVKVVKLIDVIEMAL